MNKLTPEQHGEGIYMINKFNPLNRDYLHSLLCVKAAITSVLGSLAIHKTDVSTLQWAENRDDNRG